MKKLNKSYVLFLFVIFLTAVAIEDNRPVSMIVTGAVTPTLESDIVIGIDMAHNNNISESQLSNLTTLLNGIFSPAEDVKFLSDNVNTEALLTIDVLLVLAPITSYSDSEIRDVETFIKDGNSMLVAAGYMNQTTEDANSILDPFGLSFNLSSSLIPADVRSNTEIIQQYDVLGRNFTTPITPITENISQIFLPNALGISFNETKLDSYVSPAITYFNPLLLKDSTEEPSENNTLASTLEFENGARILTIGSVDMFNDTYNEPLENTTSVFFDNSDFIINSIRWLGRNTGIMSFYNPWTDREGQSIKFGVTVYGNVTLVDSQDQSLSQTQIFIALERTGSILTKRIMNVDPLNSTKFFGSVETEGLTSGSCDIIFIANRIGYLPIQVFAGRIYLERPFPTPILPNFALWGLIIAVIVLFVSSAFLVRLNLKES
ncbi:MAG: hypothetical protein ACW98I_10260 [Candidatus Hodarchaeales archaeon]